eukprot:2358664-Alexandrium_andersonii.AAC.1
MMTFSTSVKGGHEEPAEVFPMTSSMVAAVLVMGNQAAPDDTQDPARVSLASTVSESSHITE